MIDEWMALGGFLFGQQLRESIRRHTQEIITYDDRLFRLVSLIANMCTVPLSLDAHRNAESALNVMLTTATTTTVVTLWLICIFM